MFKLIPRLKPYYTLSDWVASISIFQKNPIETYEKVFSKKFENKYGVMFQHGRTGLYALLKIWGLENDEVICPAYTCVVVPNAIVLSDNIPVFVDSDKESFNMDLNIGVGKYSITTAIHSNETHLDNCSHWLDHATDFEVAGVKGELFIGVCRLQPKIKFTSL